MINNIENGSSERLKLLRKSLNLTQMDFAKLINSSNGHVSDMEKGRKNITDSTIELLKLKLNVNEDWLRNGTGEMFVENDYINLDEFLQQKKATPIEVEIVKAYFELDPDTRSMLLNHFKQALSKPADDRDLFDISSEEDLQKLVVDIDDIDIDNLHPDIKKHVIAEKNKRVSTKIKKEIG